MVINAMYNQIIKLDPWHSGTVAVLSGGDAGSNLTCFILILHCNAAIVIGCSTMQIAILISSFSYKMIN